MNVAGSPTNGAHDGLSGVRRAPRRRRRPLLVLTAASVALVSMVAVVAQGVVSAAPAAAAKGPSCTFSAPSHTLLQIVLQTTPGEVVNTQCTGLPASNEFLQVELSLTAAVDPTASPLLTGGSVESLAGLESLIAITPELNALSINLSSSDSNGNLNVNYTVPSTSPTDPNSPCPPTTEEFNAGLIGCAVAMINVTPGANVGKPVTAGTFLLSYGKALFPPSPTLAFTPSTVTTGGTVKAMDKPGATSYWWVATLAKLAAELGGGAVPSTFPVQIRVGGRKAKGETVAVTPASYNNVTFTPPAISGSFVAKGPGKNKKVTATLSAAVLGFGLSNQVIAILHILK